MDARFGPFRVLARIARGAMGETFVAERAGPAGVVHRECLKRIFAEDSHRPDWIAMFQHEARIAAGLRHQNIVALRDFGVEGGIWWQSLDLVDGTDLRTVLADFRQSGAGVPLPSKWCCTSSPRSPRRSHTSTCSAAQTAARWASCTAT